MDLTKLKDRRKLIKDIESTENKGRVYESLRQTEIFNDRLFDHVYERLIRRTNRQTVLEMPIVSSINLARRICKQEASIYKNPPTREWTELSEDQYQVMERIYDDMAIDSKMLLSNESFKLQNQNHVMIVPVDGQLRMRVLRNHHLDSIDNPEDPERPLGYVISQIDKNEVRRNRRTNIGGTGARGRYDSWTDQEGDFVDQSIGDDDDFQKREKKYAVWTDELNFIMNDKGTIISGDDVSNPIGRVPIVDISIEKDFEYWVRQGDSITDFTVEYNALLSDISQVVRMQGYAQAYMIATDDLIPENVQVGPNFLLKLPAREGTSVRPEFGFANPGADLGGSISFAESQLATFLTSRGHDAATVSGRGVSDKATSGLDRLLRMIEKFEASRSDFDTYSRAESQLYEIVRRWHNVSLGSDLLRSQYLSTQISDQSRLFTRYAGPEMVQSDSDKVSLWNQRIEAGEATVVDMMMDLRGVDRNQAMELLKENQEIENMIMGGSDGGDITGPASDEEAES